MEESRRYVRLGLFVVVSLFAVAATLFLFGGRKLFQPTFTFETYFDQSIDGLEIGAPVRFRGVPLGHVSEIMTSSAAYERDVPIEQRRAYIVVRADVDLSKVEVAHMREDAPILIKKGLRAQPQLAGVTGQQYLSLDFMNPQKYPPLQFDWQPKYPYLPSAPGNARQIIANAQMFLANLNEADIKALSKSLNTLVSDLDTKLGELAVPELSARLQAVLGNANATLERIDRVLAAAPLDHTLRKLDSASVRLDAMLGDPALKQTVENAAVVSARLRKIAEDGDLDRMVKGIDEAAEQLDGLLGDNQYDARAVVQDLRATAANLRVLSENIKRYPAGAIVGGPPDKVQLPERSQ
jgi:ABC-type transporter Mla subunit MlaD